MALLSPKHDSAVVCTHLKAYFKNMFFYQRQACSLQKTGKFKSVQNKAESPIISPLRRAQFT